MQPIILSIGALDTSGGAGINQDTRVAALHKCLLINCITGITIQDKTGLKEIHCTPTEFFEKMLDIMLNSYRVGVIKIGAICSLAQIEILCRKMKDLKGIPIILDPVIKPTQGDLFIPEASASDYLELMPVVDYLLPNYPELEFLSHLPVHNPEEAVVAAKQLSKKYSTAILLKSGHSRMKRLQEGIVTSTSENFFTKKRYNWTYTHGTGCALATAFACNLTKNIPAFNAYKRASRWLSRYYDEIQDWFSEKEGFTDKGIR